MKLLKQFQQASDARLLACKLESEGILTFVSNERTKGLRGASTLSTVGVWAVLPEQYEDAIASVLDPEHRVKKPLSKKQIKKLKQQTDNVLSPYITKLLNSLMVLVLVGLIVWVVLSIQSS